MNALGTESSAHLLVVDDDRQLRELLTRFLGKHGYRVTTARDGQEMWQALKDWRIDLIVLDLMLPGDDGLTLCRRLRADSRLPIIMLTAMGEETDRILGIEMGADDYLPKPFNPRELLARIKAVLRRTQEAALQTGPRGDAPLRFAGWRLDPVHRKLESPDRVVVELSGGEFDLLLAFAEHPRRVLSRDQLLDLSRGRAAVPFDRSVDVQVGRLRRKIEADPKDPQLIKTVRGGGYLFTPAVERT
jgi:two-component system OmpR family response regulator